MHVLVHCSHAKRFWMEDRNYWDLKLWELHPATWTRDIICDLLFPEMDGAKIIIVMWVIWMS
jgi:hypothetical protein